MDNDKLEPDVDVEGDVTHKEGGMQVGAIVGAVWALFVKVKDTETSLDSGTVMLLDKGNGGLVHTGIASQDYPLKVDMEDGFCSVLND
eukprot:jgi/Pico_ML_1/54748/g616.t1